MRWDVSGRGMYFVASFPSIATALHATAETDTAKLEWQSLLQTEGDDVVSKLWNNHVVYGGLQNVLQYYVSRCKRNGKRFCATGTKDWSFDVAPIQRALEQYASANLKCLKATSEHGEGWDCRWYRLFVVSMNITLCNLFGPLQSFCLRS